jgi:magnesium transporter
MPNTGSQEGSSYGLPPDRDLVRDLEEILDKGPRLEQLKLRLRDLPPEDIARVLWEMDSDDKVLLFRALSDEAAAQVLDETDEDSKADLLESVGIGTLTRVMEEMPPDEVVDLLAFLTAEQRRRVLEKLDSEHARRIRELEKFDPETAGGLMTNEFLAVPPDRAIHQVLEDLKREEEEELLADVYIVDEWMHLLGVISVKEMVVEDPRRRIGDIMLEVRITVPPEMDREEVSRIVDHYHLSSIPVVDERGSLLGVVTYDDVMDVIQEEASEDMYRLAGTWTHNPFVEPIHKRVGYRLPWLIVTMIGGFGSVAVISRFSAAIEENPPLAFFIPIIGALAGNVGVQSSTIMVRGFATGDIPVGRTLGLFARELAIGVAIGSICGLATGIFAAVAVEDVGAAFGFGVAVSIFCAISAAAGVGTLVPIFCSRVGVDPALAAGPFVTTVVDLAGHLIYFLVLTLVLISL